MNAVRIPALGRALVALITVALALASPASAGKATAKAAAPAAKTAAPAAETAVAPAHVAEVAHLIANRPGVLVPTYTLGDETRPLLAGPTEITLSVAVPREGGDHLTFDLPASVSDATTLTATGSYDGGIRTFPMQAQRAPVSDAAGVRRATMAVPPLAHGRSIALTLTRPPAASVLETEVAIAAVARGAALRFAYALSEAAALPGGAPVTFEIATREPATAAPLWSAVLDPTQMASRRWQEASVPLDALAGTPGRLVFRTRTSDDGRATLVPLWADPTITAPAPRPPTRRNVVLISLDTLRADRLGVYGAYRATTPAIDAFAREGVIFDEAWSVWPETSGSHMSIFTSRPPSEHGVTSFITAPPPSVTLLAEHLRAHGYLTRAFTEDGGVWANAGFARGFSAYGERRSATAVYPGEAAATFADATHWVEANGDRTFFLFVHTYQVHAPYKPPRAYKFFFADVPGREVLGQADNALNYDRETRYTDDQVGPFLATLRRLGLAERTLVVLLSDHGEEFGEHGGMGHGRTLYREVLQVPLVLWAPGLLPAARVATPVSLLDVAPTLLDLLGVPPDPTHRGLTLAALARGRSARGAGAAARDRPIYGEVDRDDLIAHDHVRAISVRRSGQTAIANLVDGTTRCYGADDRAEQKPLPDCGAFTALLAKRAAGLPWGRAPAGAGTPSPAVDPRTVEKMRALGYVE